MNTEQVLKDVAAERGRQDAKWGGADHDDHHSTAEFVQLIQDYAGWARVMAGMGSPAKARRRLVQAAALAVAAVESIDRVYGLTPTCIWPDCGHDTNQSDPVPGCRGKFCPANVTANAEVTGRGPKETG